MGNLFWHFLRPMHANNHRARLLHIESIFLVAIFFLGITFILTPVKKDHPEVLGSSVDISSQDLLTLTNIERQKVHLAPLVVNPQLAIAADNKAKDMFLHNYWAHISPTGVTPWVFITNAGYAYQYAGENLARGFSSAGDTVQAWMASPTHRENIVSSNYQEVGFAVEDGTLTGEAHTILVVQMFGSRQGVSAKTNTGQAQIPIAKAVQAAEKNPQQQSEKVVTSSLIDKFAFAKNITQFLLILFIILFIADILFIERKKISRIAGHNFDHILFLTAILIFIVLIGSGVIF